MKLPWEKDPNDREANYKRPVPRHEGIRMGSKFVFAAAAGIWLVFSTRDRCQADDLHDVCRPSATDAGPKLLLAIGATMTVLAAIDLWYLRRHEIELVFARSKKHQVVGRAALAVAGFVAMAAATTRLI